MLFVRQTHNQLTIHIFPVSTWIAAIVIISLGVLITEAPAIQLFLLAMGVLWFLAGGRIVACQFNKTTGQVMLKRLNVLGSKRIRCSIRDVTEVRLDSYWSDGQALYRVALVLANREDFLLRGDYSTGLKDKHALADRICKFLNLSSPTIPDNSPPSLATILLLLFGLLLLLFKGKQK